MPKTWEGGAPLRPITRSIKSVPSNISQQYATGSAPLLGDTAHHTDNCWDLVDKTGNLKMDADEPWGSLDVTPLLTCFPTW